MKAFPALLVAATLLAPTLRAQETPAKPDAKQPIPSSESPVADAPAPPTPDLTPAQDIPTPMPQRSLDLNPAQEMPTPAPTPTTPEPALIPETPVPTEKPSGTAVEEPKKKDKDGKDKEKEKPNKTAAVAEEIATRVRFRQVKTRALKDPAVQTEWTRSEKAHTEFEKREALKRYYKLLYARMEKIDGSLKKQIAAQQTTSIRRLEQTRIDPTETPEANLRAARLDYE